MLPAAKCIPVVQALQKIRDRKLAVIGEGKSSGCGGVKGGHYGAGVPRDRLLPAPESFRQRFSIVGVFYLLGGAPPQEGGPPMKTPWVAANQCSALWIFCDAS